MTDPPDPTAWGITSGYHHVDGHWVHSPEAGVAAALAAMGADGEPPSTRTWVVDRRQGLHVPFPATLVAEDGGSEQVAGQIPPGALPLGYHWIEPAHGGDPIRLIVSPGVCPRPDRMWGWAVQLYAARSRTSWGMGDLGDLRRLAASDAPLLLINPLHAVAPVAAQQASPYFPASRRWRNPIYIDVESVPGREDIPSIDELARVGEKLNADRVIDRDEVWRIKRLALEAIWARTGLVAESERWIEAQGPSLVGFAAWAALTDDHGPDWRTWPIELREFGSPAVKAWTAEHRDDVMFHAWMQWLISEQLAAASAEAVIAGDLAIGVDPAGADAWQWPDVLAPGVTIGAPPDEFNPLGQDWSMPPFDPWRLRAAAYEPFVDMVRAAFTGMNGVRIDHVAGLFRAFWVPSGGPAADGVYVRYPWQDLLNIVALEAERAGGFVVGEDLGTVEPDVRRALAERNVLSYRLLWFEDDRPARWPELSLGAITTHDLPTLAGVWRGTDGAEFRARLTASDADGVSDVARAIYAELAVAPPLIVMGTLEDVLEVEERPNHPGTTDEFPNWSLALPVPLEDVLADPRFTAAEGALTRPDP